MYVYANYSPIYYIYIYIFFFFLKKPCQGTLYWNIDKQLVKIMEGFNPPALEFGFCAIGGSYQSSELGKVVMLERGSVGVVT